MGDKKKRTSINLVGSSGKAKPAGRKRRLSKSKSRRRAGTGRIASRAVSRSTR